MTVIALSFTLVLVGCNSEEKQLIKEHEKEVRTEDPQKKDLSINFQDFREVKRVGDAETIMYVDGRLYYSDGGESREITLDDVEYELSIDNDPLKAKGEVQGSIYKATFTVENEEMNVESRTIERFYYIDRNSEVLIPIN